MSSLVEDYYRNNYDRLVKTVVRRLDNNYDIAEEAVQEAFTKALTFLDAFNPSRHEFGAWFNTILNNCVRDAHQSERNRGMSLDEVGCNIPDKSEDRCQVLNVTKAEILEKIGTMNEGAAKKVVTLHYIKGQQPRHICQILDLPSNGYVRFIIATWRSQMIKEFK